jgi:3-deoxy-D-manno-octulosonic-acid transferase
VLRRSYTLLLYLLTPVVLFRLLLRALKAPDYRRRWPERFGFAPAPYPSPGAIWVHAVSVGETQAALPLIRALLRNHPERSMIVTTTTPTGSGRVRDALGGRVYHCYLPYDLPDALGRFLGRLQPALLLVMETEIWPNLYRACQRRGIPVLLANARLSPRSFRGYARVRPLAAQALSRLRLVAAQSDADAQRFVALGAPAARVRALGNIKFDIQIAAAEIAEGRALRERIGAERPVLIAASTHAGEEQQVLEAFASIRRQQPDCRLILVPRHPERFAEAGRLAAQCGYRVARRSSGDDPGDADVYLGDTLGELVRLFAAADVAFVGGSLVPVGGHNILEPAALGVPVLHGPHMFNFVEAADRLGEAGASEQVANATELAERALILLHDSEARKRAGTAGRHVIETNRGALERLSAEVQAALRTLVPSSSGLKPPR